jgi:glycosyltransferase involved in cell wall biosynthesis
VLYGVRVEAPATNRAKDVRAGTRVPSHRLVAVCTAEPYTNASAGPALRAVGLARGLTAAGLDVVLAAPSGSHAPGGCGVVPLDDLGGLVERGATMIISGFLLERYPVLAQARHVVVDAAGPFLLENLVVHQTQTPERRRRVLTDESAVLARLLAAADLVLCAHDRQRDLTLGMMLGSGSLRPELIDDDPGLARFFLTVPFGPTGEIDPIERAPTAGRLHLVWPGGLWDWLDPVCLVEGLARARAAGVDVTAELWGARSLDPLVPPSRAARLVVDRARELGVSEAIEVVGWVPHAERRARLANADVAVTLDPGGIEARYAFRTRLVDALASGLPIIATAGEFVTDDAATRGAGFTIAPADPGALAALLGELAGDPARLAAARARAPAVARQWTYERTVEPLAAWCREPRRARAGAPSSSAPAAGILQKARGRVQRALRPST